MDDEENQDQLINRNTSQGKSRRQGPFVASDDEDVEESDGSRSEEEDDMDEEDGEEEDGSDSEEDEDEEDLPVGSSDPTLSAADLNEAMSSDEERENCPICLNGFRDQVVGTPENCNHYFCLECIVEWSKNANSCPVDRITFSCIHIRAHYGGEILKKVPIQSKADENLLEEEDPTNCEVCGRSDREDRLLLCDGCDAGYHMECLTPPLNAIPVDEWFCPECAATNQPDEDAVSEEEVSSLLADVVPTTSRLRTNVVRTRAIARTRQSERVRASVNRIRTTARRSQNVPRYLLSSLLDETIEAVVAGLNTAVYQRNLTPRTTTTRRKRRTGKKTGESKASKGSRGVRKRRKRRFKRRKGRKQMSRKVPTSHRRIARSLGMCSPHRGSALPRIQRAQEQTIGSMRHDIGAATLSVFGNPNDLDPFDSNDDQISNLSSPLTAKRRILSRSALRSHQPVARPISVGLSRGRVPSLASDSVAVAEPVPDLLGSILSGQSMLMMKSSDIVISRDGSLTAKKSGEISSQNSREEISPAGLKEPSPSHSGSPTISSSPNTWKPVEQQTHLSFPSSDLYSLSPSPSPPPSSSSSISMDRLSVPNSSMPGISPFRLKNAFTPRIVQVQSTAGRLTSKGAELLRMNGTLHKPESASLNDPIPPKPPEFKHLIRPPAKRLDISEFPRIPKIKKETNISPNSEGRKRLESSASSSANPSLPRPLVNQLTGRGESKQLGRFNTSENTEKSTRQESQAPSRPCGGISSSHTASSNSKAPLSNSSRNAGSSDSGGGLRITISGSSSNSCRQFSPSAKDPFRTSEGKTQQKATPLYPSNNKRDKTIKNEIYDPFEPTGSDSGSQNSSPERPVTPPIPSTSTENTSTAPSTGVKVGAFRSFKFTTHSSRVGVSKLGPDFSGLSPNNKESQERKSPENVSPVSPPTLKMDKEIKKEIKEELTEHIPFRITCPLSGLKITSDLTAGGTRGFHFDVEDQPKISIKTEPDILPNRTFHHSTAGGRVVWEEEEPLESCSLSISHSTEIQKKKITVKEEPKPCSRSRSRTRSRERELRSASWSAEEKERKLKSKSHKVKRSRSDRSSSGSCERSKKKRQKEKKKEKKKKNYESKERRRSRSSSRSSSSHRICNSKKKKKKKRDSRSESASRRSVSPEKEKKRKHKSDKSFSNKESTSKVKEKKKSKEDREKQKTRSQPLTKESKTHKSRDKSPTFRDQEITRHIVLSPNDNETTIMCTVSFKSESPTIVQETKRSMLLIPKEEVHERHAFQYLESNISIKEEKDVELSDHDEEVKMEPDSPPWSPSLLDSLVPENKDEDIPEPPSPKESSPLNDLLATSVVSPQASLLSTGTEPASPKSHSPQPSCGDHSTSTAVLTVKTEDDDLQWSPSHLDDFLLNELSDDVCSVEADSPDDVDLEEAIMMKREGDCKELAIINFSKKAVIPFLQDDENSGDGAAGNHIAEKSTNNGNTTVEDIKSDDLKEAASSSVSKSKPQIKRVTWDFHQKDTDKNDTTEESVSSPLSNAQSEAWAASPGFTGSQVTSYKPDSSSETSSPLAWNTPDASTQGSLIQSVGQGSWNSENRTQNNVKAEDKPIAHAVNQPGAVTRERQVKDASQIPWIATDTPVQVLLQTLPPLPLPPVFPPYALVSEPTVPCVLQSSRTMPSQTPKPGSLATANEPKMQAASTGETKGKSKSKSKPKKGENVKNEEYMKKLHMQERAVEEVKLAIKPFYQKREITKDEYKEILRKAVQKICHSKSGEINPVKVVNLVKGYVDKYKHIRNKQKKSEIFEDPDLGRDSPI